MLFIALVDFPSTIDHRPRSRRVLSDVDVEMNFKIDADSPTLSELGAHITYRDLAFSFFPSCSRLLPIRIRIRTLYTHHCTLHCTLHYYNLQYIIFIDIHHVRLWQRWWRVRQPRRRGTRCPKQSRPCCLNEADATADGSAHR